MHEKQARYESEMRKARKRVARQDAWSEKAGFPGRGKRSDGKILQSAMRKLEAAIVLQDWNDAAEAQAVLEQLHKRLPDPATGKAGPAFESGRAVVFVKQVLAKVPARRAAAE